MRHYVVQVFVFLACFLTVQAATRNVFFAGGQSNATAAWGAALASGLQAEFGADLVMVHVNHSGEAMDRWFTTSPRVNYSNDFFNASGTGALQAQIHALTNAGDQVVFKGFFWFQGESDTGSYASMDAYSSRFLGMMAQLKSDLAMANDVDFTLAVIDMNPAAFYDDPANTGGRTRADIDYFRAIQTTMSTGAHRAYVDTRGYTRTDAWHLTTDERVRLAAAMSTTHSLAFGTPHTVDIFSAAADGCVYASGFFDAIDQICGNVDSNAYNGISLFKLPSNLVDIASLSLTVVTDHGAMTNANIDLWGVGYVTTPAMNKAWLLLGDTDTRLLLNNTAPVKIADNIVTNGQPMPADTVWQTDGTQQVSLKNFINGLYAQGAVPGDYAVLRTNPDAVPAARTAGLRWGGSNQATNKQAKLTVTLSDVPIVDESITLISHPADGCVYDTGTFVDNDLICGYTGGHPYNGIAFFQLPSNRMDTANIRFTVEQNYGPLTNANIDVWGLGYMKTPAMNKAWILMADTDTRALVNTNVTFTKIADDFVPVGESTPVGSVNQLEPQDRTNLVGFLNSLYDKGAVPGDYAVIRVNPDAWFTAGQNVRWGGTARTSPDRRTTLTITLSDEPAIPDDVTLYSHENDGSVYQTGIFPSQQMICGTAGNPNTIPWNGVSFFQLPSNRVVSANLIFTVYQASASWSGTGAGIDVWGLGSISGTPTLDAAWLLMADTDARTLLNDAPPAKLADNLVAAGASPVVDDVYTLNTAQRSGLVAYINGLFDNGAKPGDYAVIRMNPDTAIAAGGVSLYFGSSSAVSPDRRALMTMRLSDEPVIPPTTLTIYSHENDGAVYGDPPGIFPSLQLICGTAGNPNTRPWNGVSFFQLPSQRVSAADLAYKVYSASAGWAATGAAIDVWGLGFIRGTPTLIASWLLMGDTDTRTLLNGSTPSKIADNLLAAGVTPAVGSVWSLSGAQSTNLVDFINGLFEKGAQPGDYAVIRVNPDTPIATGGVSIYFGSSSDVSPDRRNTLTYTVSGASWQDGLFQHYSQANDGGVYGSGANSGWDLISGTGGTPTFDVSGVAFFALPEQRLTSATIALVAESVSGALVGANLDVWGLGYMTTPALNQNWLCISNEETRTFLNGYSPVKLADNVVTAGQTVAVGSVLNSTEAQRLVIADYLNGLYDNGANPGDFAVIRINMDASQAGLNAGVRWGGSHRTAPDHRPLMYGVLQAATNYLSNSSFETGTGSAADNWTVVENGHEGERVSSFSRSGTHAYKMSANGTTGTYGSMYIAQDVSAPDFAGRRVTLSGYAYHDSADPMVSNSAQRVSFRIFWLGGTQANTWVNSSDLHNLLPTDVQNKHKAIYVSAIAPVDVTGIKVVIIFDTGTTADPSITTGAGIVDDLRLTVFTTLPPAGTLLLFH